MTETFKCPACGAANNLPDGKTSVPCQYCGASIHLPQITNTKGNDKPRLSKIKLNEDSELNELSYINRNITSLDEVIEVYSDNELVEIYTLNLSKNKIKSLAGIERFTLRELNMSYNDIQLVDYLPEFKSSYSVATGDFFHSVELDFSNNENLKGFSQNAIDQIHRFFFHIDKVELNLIGCNNFDFEQLSKINFSKPVFQYDSSKVTIWVDASRPLPDSLKGIGFEPSIYLGRTMWTYQPKPVTSRGTQESKGNCFIATATMGSYDHPLVLELRNFRDEWILTKRWGEGFIKWYYRYGAMAARVISKSIVLKKMSYWFIVKPILFISRLLRINANL